MVTLRVAFIGFGEAGRTFASATDWRGSATAYDILTDSDIARAAQWACYEEACVIGAADIGRAVSDRTIIFSLVTADQALHAAQNAADHIACEALYLDMNSVAPGTKRAAARAIEAAGGRYVDVAIMAPVIPAALSVALLLSGPHGEAGAAALARVGFGNIRVIAGAVGRASSVKMIRSVMVKGVEALTAEMMLAARAANVESEVLASLGDGWDERAAYNLERMTRHGARRAAEMEESARTLTALGIEPVMTRGTIVRQRAMAT